MQKKEVINFMERIKSHYQEFIIDEFKISEWYGKLKDYDAEDVNKKLDDHLCNEEYGHSIPKVAFLTKYLTKSADKGKVIHHTIICNICGYSIPDEEYDKHSQRCCEASTVRRDLKKFFNKRIDKDKLMNLSNDEFEKVYQAYLDKILEAPNLPDFRKKIILRCICPDMDIDVNEIVKEMVQK